MRTTTLTSIAALALGGVLAPATVATAHAVGETCDGRPATIVVPAPARGAYETAPVSGTSGDDVIVGTDVADTIDGGGGNDVVCALEGADVVTGGPGDDRLFGGLNGHYHADRIEPGPGDDFVDLGPDPGREASSGLPDSNADLVSYRHAAGPVLVDLAAGTATGEGTDTIAPNPLRVGVEGSPFDDRLLGTERGDWILAGGGDDFVDSLGGRDKVEADLPHPDGGDTAVPGDDVVDAGAGDDYVYGGFGDDRLRGGSGRDTLEVAESEGARAFGGPGPDTFYTYGFTLDFGRALLAGGPGDDQFIPTLTRRSDHVEVRGGAGRDLYRVLSWPAAPKGSRIAIDGRTGRVRTAVGVMARFSAVEVYEVGIGARTPVDWWGTWRDDVLDLAGHGARVRAFGRGGDDFVRGGWDPDLLDGGPGRDRLYGGEGRDRCLHGERLFACEARR